MVDKILLAVIAAAAILVAVGVQQEPREVYPQGMVSFDEINENHIPFILSVLDGLKSSAITNPQDINLSIWEDGRALTISYTNGTPNDLHDDSRVTLPHNLTAANGYVYRGGDTILQPNGTELFAD